MKRKWKSILALVCFVFASLMILVVSSKIFIPKWTTNKDAKMTNVMQGFYQLKPNSLDVLFLGDSSAYRGISPLEIWQQTGITSYVYGSPAQRAWLGYYMLKHALAYQKPKVVVLEASELLYGNNVRSGYTRKVLDNMRWGSAKMEAIQDPIFKFGLDTKLSYFFPILEYHDRYNELNGDDFKYAFQDLDDNDKGYAFNAVSTPYVGSLNFMDKQHHFTLPNDAKKYADKMIDLCKQNHIKLIFINVPKAKGWSYAEHNAVKTFADQKGVPFIDFNIDMKTDKINWKRDTVDRGTHLNIRGAEKVSHELSLYFEKNEPYLMHEKKDPAVIKQYNTALKKYLKEKAKVKGTMTTLKSQKQKEVVHNPEKGPM